MPRILTFYNFDTKKNDNWYPITANSGLGFGFTLTRNDWAPTQSRWGKTELSWRGAKADLQALKRLDIVRTNELQVSAEYLALPLSEHRLGR